MSAVAIEPTGIERTFCEDEIIVSKTHRKGRCRRSLAAGGNAKASVQHLLQTIKVGE